MLGFSQSVLCLKKIIIIKRPGLPNSMPPEFIDDGLQSSPEFNEKFWKIKPLLFTEVELNDIEGDLGLTNEKSELLGSKLFTIIEQEVNRILSQKNFDNRRKEYFV